ncbi:hypothetical protein L195_g022424, partial [Trifolium pratense]
MAWLKVAEIGCKNVAEIAFGNCKNVDVIGFGNCKNVADLVNDKNK